MVGIQVVAVVVEIVTVRVTPLTTEGILSFRSSFSSVLELSHPCNQT